MNVQERKKQATVERILFAALEIFADSGFEGARIDEIADRAAVNKAMIYYHIGDKNALYTRVLHEVFGDTAIRMADNVNRCAAPVEKMRAYIRSIGQTLEKHPHLPRIMMWELASGGLHLPEIVAQDLASIIGLIRSIIRQGHRQGIFKKLDPLVLHLMVLGGISFYRAGNPVRLRYTAQMGENAAENGNAPLTHLLKKVEKIILCALKHD
jgi:AcrR family transcriptional regulator